LLKNIIFIYPPLGELFLYFVVLKVELIIKDMKKLIYIFVFLAVAGSFTGCDYIIAPANHYVSIYNNESDKYISTVYFRDNYYGEDMWSKNMVNAFVYPYETMDLLFEEGIYDFKVFLEDDYYSYEITFYDVYVYNNVSLDVCLDCYDKKSNVKIIRTAKTNKNNVENSRSDSN